MRVAWLAAFVCLVALSMIPVGVWSAVIAGVFFVLFLVVCWGYRQGGVS